MPHIFPPIFVIVLFSFNKPAGKFSPRGGATSGDSWPNRSATRPLTDALQMT